MSGAAELLIVGRIATLAGDDGFGWAGAVALGGGRVIASGSPDDVEAACGPATRRVRLADDQAAMPGITDAHIHLAMLARGRDELDLSGTSSLEGWLYAIAQAHGERAAAGDNDGWLLGHGWSPAAMAGWPEGQMLEGVAPGRPIALWAHDHHSRWVSATALGRSGIGRDTADPDGGVIRRDDEGRPTGMLHEAAAALVNPFIPEPDEARLQANLTAVAADLAALGVIACHDPGELDTETGIGRAQRMYRAMAAAGRLPLRVHASIRDHHLSAALEAGMRSGAGVEPDAPDSGTARRLAERYRMGWLKLFSDGSLGSRSAALLEPYTDALEHEPTGGPAGMLLHQPEELVDTLRQAAGAGIAGQVHAIGDAAVRLALDLLAGQPRLPLRSRIEHAQLVDPADVARFGKLGVAASVQPVHLRSDAPIARRAWGARADLAFPLAGLVRGGALIPFGTDAPVEPIDPWPGIAAAVARRDPLRPADPLLGAEEAIGLARAIRAACLDPAQVAGEEDRGRLVPGHRADLLIVPLTALTDATDPAELAATRPIATLIDGELVHGDDLMGW